MYCTRCDNSGFLNTHQLPENLAKLLDELGAEDFLNHASRYLKDRDNHDVQVCDCCGNGEDEWYGTPGEHYNSEDPRGENGPYAYNGGLCECN